MCARLCQLSSSLADDSMAREFSSNKTSELTVSRSDLSSDKETLALGMPLEWSELCSPSCPRATISFSIDSISSTTIVLTEDVVWRASLLVLFCNKGKSERQKREREQVVDWPKLSR